MKKVTICTMLLIFSATSFSQQTNPATTFSKQDYLKKSKRQKTAAWILLGGGAVVGFVGLTQLNFAGSDNGEVNNTPGAVLFFTGVASVITSIPIFSAAKRNRNKAMSMSFKNQSFPQLQNNKFAYKAIPSLTLKISL